MPPSVILYLLVVPTSLPPMYVVMVIYPLELNDLANSGFSTSVGPLNLKNEEPTAGLPEPLLSTYVL